MSERSRNVSKSSRNARRIYAKAQAVRELHSRRPAMTRAMFPLRVLLALALSACAPAAYHEVRIGEPRAPRPESCEIVWLSIDEHPAAGRDQIAMLSNVSVGSNPSSAEAREQVRRRACALGGDAATLVASANDRAAYLVWANRPSARP